MTGKVASVPWYGLPSFFSVRIREDEDVVGFMIGCALKSMSKISPGRDIYREGFSWRFPSRLSEVVKNFTLELPGVDELVNSHTRFGIYKPFLSVDQARELYVSHVDGPLRPGMSMPGVRARNIVGKFKFCPLCTSDDLKDYGYPIWRRNHLMPGVLACVRHQRMLVTFCDFCESRMGKRNVLWQPNLRCHCGKPLNSVARLGDADIGISLDVAAMADDLLRGTAPEGLSPEVISTALRCHLGAGSSRQLCERLYDALRDTLGEEAIRMIGIGRDALTRFVGMVPSSSPIRHPIRSLTVVRAIFGGWAGLMDAIFRLDGREEVLDRKRRPFERGEGTQEGHRRKEYAEFYRSLSEPERSELRGKHRTWLLDIIRQYPEVRRRDLLQFSGYWPAIRHLMSIDEIWFEQTLPKNGKPRINLDSPADKALTRRVAQVVAHIRACRALAISESPQFRIRKSYLTYKVHSAYRADGVADHPDVQEALADCIDTFETWRGRVVRYIVEQVRPRLSGHYWADESWWQALKINSYQYQRRKAMQWLEKQDDYR